MKKFSEWKREEIEDVFLLTEVEELIFLKDWIAYRSDILDNENQQITKLCNRLRKHVIDWNEEELKMHFIALLLDLVDFNQKNSKAFFERTFEVKVNNDVLKGNVECVIARGKRSPKAPFFCLHEYKKEIDSSSDPLGQVLIAMVAAQMINQDSEPVYGVYIVGRFWHFLVLHEKKYCLNLALDATKKNDIESIFFMLKYIKKIVKDRTE
jgi:hypothetical protein